MAIIGIDLGTTNTLASVWKNGTYELIPNSLGSYLTPSVVGVNDKGEILTGQTAKEQLGFRPEQTVSSFKRYMGTEKTWRLGEKNFSPQELSALVLTQIREDASRYLGEPVEEAVISVPAYFNDMQRQATRMAGRLAGLKVERLVNEPSAAALAYRMNLPGPGETLKTEEMLPEEDQTFLVFDFGGGTLDISIVDAFDNVIEIVAVAGDNHLGGDDINQALAERFLAEKHLDEGNLTKEERASLLRESERLKRLLSSEEKGTMEVVIGGEIRQMELDQKGLLEVAAPVLESIGLPLSRAMTDSGYGWGDIDGIIMVGGSGKMPVVQNYLHFLSGKKPVCRIDPDVAVAAGAGIYAGMKERAGELRDMLLTDICPFTLGTEVTQEDRSAPSVMAPVIERNSTLPVSRMARYTTANPFQSHCTVRVLQGEHRLAEQNLCLGELDVEVPVGQDPGHREAIDVRYTYDINGILEIDVTVASTGKTTSRVIINKNIKMAEEELRLRREALQKLKISPRDQEINRVVLARGDRLFEENTGEIRQYVSRFMEEFTTALGTQNGRTIQEARERTTELFDIIENSPKKSVKLRLDKYLYDEWRRNQ